MKKKICLLWVMIMMFFCMVVPYTVSANDAGYLYKVYVSTSDGFLNMRMHASTSAKIITEIPDCVGIEIFSTDGDWGYGECYLDTVSYRGWVYLPGTENTYERARDKAGKATNMRLVVDGSDGYVNMRKEPTTKLLNVIASIPNGKEIVVNRKTDKNWGLVHYGGETGWIALSETSPIPVASEEPEEKAEETNVPGFVEESTPTMETKKGSLTLEGEKILGGNTLVLVLIGVAIFLIIVVAILLIVVLNRGKNEIYDERKYDYRDARYDWPEQDAPINYGQQTPQNQNYGNQNYPNQSNQNYNNQNYRQ